MLAYGLGRDMLENVSANTSPMNLTDSINSLSQPLIWVLLGIVSPVL